MIMMMIKHYYRGMDYKDWRYEDESQILSLSCYSTSLNHGSMKCSILQNGFWHWSWYLSWKAFCRLFPNWGWGPAYLYSTTWVVTHGFVSSLWCRASHGACNSKSSYTFMLIICCRPIWLLTLFHWEKKIQGKVQWRPPT